MTTDQTQYVGWFLILLINIVGWWRAAESAKKSTLEAARVAKETAVLELKRIEHTLEDLPCEVDREYAFKQGKLYQKVTDMEATLQRIEKKLDARNDT